MWWCRLAWSAGNKPKLCAIWITTLDLCSRSSSGSLHDTESQLHRTTRCDKHRKQSADLAGCLSAKLTFQSCRLMRPLRMLKACKQCLGWCMRCCAAPCWASTQPATRMPPRPSTCCGLLCLLRICRLLSTLASPPTRIPILRSAAATPVC